MLEIEESNIEWTKYKQARYFHKLALTNLVNLDVNFEQSKRSTNESLVKEQKTLIQTAYSSAQSHMHNIGGKANVSKLQMNAKKYNTCHSTRQKHANNRLNTTNIIQEAQTERKTIAENKTCNIIRKAIIKRNKILNNTHNIKLSLISPSSKLKSNKNFTSPKQSVINHCSSRKERVEVESKVEVKRQLHAYSNTRASNLSKVTSGKTLNSCVFRTPNTSARKVHVPSFNISKNTNINARSKATRVRLSQPKQFKNAKNLKPNSILNINELVQRFDEFIWKI
jgi:hypothetical protein